MDISKLEPKDFIPCPSRPNHWVQVVYIEQKTYYLGGGKYEIEPAKIEHTGFILVGKQGDTLEETLERVKQDENQ